MEGDWKQVCRLGITSDFNPLPPCGGRPAAPTVVAGGSVISIHSLRVEGDKCRLRGISAGSISIHSLRVEGDATNNEQAAEEPFQSTPSVWRETLSMTAPCGEIAISIHSLRVEGDSQTKMGLLTAADFNPLPPCGGRQRTGSKWWRKPIFQSTPSVWRETTAVPVQCISRSISIHSLRVEGDPAGISAPYARRKFQSTPSVWRETTKGFDKSVEDIFQSTPSVWRETVRRAASRFPNLISIHSLRVEGDLHAV